MNTASNYGKDADRFLAQYAPEMIPRYVSADLRRMYTGTAPSLTKVVESFGEKCYRDWFSSMVESLLKFAGLEKKFDTTQLSPLADMARSRHPMLKVTEIMHFVYLCQSGEYEGFYGNPNGRTLLSQLNQYVRTDREKHLARYRDMADRESQYMERAYLRAANEGNRRAELNLIAAELAELLSPEKQQRYGSWRREPWGTEICRAYFVDHSLGTFPRDMTEADRRDWAMNHGFDVAAGEWTIPND